MSFLTTEQGGAVEKTSALDSLEVGLNPSSLTSCMPWSKLFNLSGPEFPCLLKFNHHLSLRVMVSIL